MKSNDDPNQAKPDTDETPPSQGQRLLVVMVNTLAGPEVFDYLHGIGEDQRTEFYLMVPAVRPDYGLTWTNAQASRDAQDRMEIMLEFMNKAGMSVRGEVRTDAPSDALELVALGPEGPFDKVVVVWREQKYRWFYGSVRERLEQLLGIPIESLEASPPVRDGRVENPTELRELFEMHASKRGWLR